MIDLEKLEWWVQYVSIAIGFFGIIYTLRDAAAIMNLRKLDKGGKKENYEINDELFRIQDDEFIARATDSYGYDHTKFGNINQWRYQELLGLIGSTKTNNKEKEIVYLDYAGADLPMQSQLKHIMNHIYSSHILGNPHSSGPASTTTHDMITQARRDILKFFCTDSIVREEYEVIFTSGATQAIQILGESFPFTNYSHLIYPQNAHTSVVGVRELAITKGSSVTEVTTDSLKSNIFNCLPKQKGSAFNNDCDSRGCSLVMFTLESNFNGERFPVRDIARLIKEARRRRIFVFLDAAKYASTHPLDLSQTGADFICVSFYKIFGFPTGLGALIVKKRSMQMLDPTKRGYFGGGSLAFLSKKYHSFKTQPIPSQEATTTTTSTTTNTTTTTTTSTYANAIINDDVVTDADSRIYHRDAFVHGTNHYQGIASLSVNFEMIERLGGMNAISKHCMSLALELADRLHRLRHHDGTPVVQLYGAWNRLLKWAPRTANGYIAITDFLRTIQRIEEGKDGLNVDDNIGIESETLNGPVVTFNILIPSSTVSAASNAVVVESTFVPYVDVAEACASANPPIQVRTGCFCSPGGCLESLNISEKEHNLNFHVNGIQCGHHDSSQCIGIHGKPTGAVRASLGKTSMIQDVLALVQLVQDKFIQHKHNSRSEPADASPIQKNDTHIIGREINDVKIDSSIDSSEIDSSEGASIHAILVYPIKSCGAMSVKRWPIEGSNGGLLFDRYFAIVNADTGRVLRLAKHPSMVHIRPLINLELRTMTLHWTAASDSLFFSKEVSEISIPLDDGADDQGHIGGERTSKWLTNALNMPCYLISCKTENCNQKEGNSNPSSFVNNAPLLVVRLESVLELNQQRKNCSDLPSTEITYGHFRPNIVVSSNVHEDYWKNVMICDGSFVSLEVISECKRCSTVNVDPLQTFNTHTSNTPKVPAATSTTIPALSVLQMVTNNSTGKCSFGVYCRAISDSHHCDGVLDNSIGSTHGHDKERNVLRESTLAKIKTR